MTANQDQSIRNQSLGATALVYGAVAGTVTYLLGYLIVFTTASSAVERIARGYGPLEGAGAPFAPAWKAAGWAFYDAHLVGTRLPGVSGHVDLVSLAGVQFLYLVPPLLLVLAGGVVAMLVGVDGPRSGVRAGLTIAVGYLLFAVIGALLVSFVGIQPDLLRASVIAGVVYPIAFGAIGGWLVGVVRADRRPAADGRLSGTN